MRARELQFQTCKKSSVDHLYLNYSKIFGKAFEFYESNRLLVTACWEDIDSTVLPNQGNNMYGSQHWKNTPPRYLYSWNGAVCPRCILYTAQKLQGKLLLWAWIVRTDSKFSIFHLRKLDSCGPKSALEKTSGSFISSLQWQLWSAFEFFEWNRLLVIPCCEVITQYSWLNQVNRGYGSQNSQNSWLRHLFSWKGAVCPSRVFYAAQKLQGKLSLWAW